MALPFLIVTAIRMDDWIGLREELTDIANYEVLQTRAQNQALKEAIRKTRADQRAALLEISREGETEHILEAERILLVQEQEHLAGSQAMASSLDNAIKELDAALSTLERVRDPDAYQSVADSFSLDKNRVGGLPRDEARQFFRSHLARLGNLDKGRLSDSERDVLKARMFNIRTAEHQYKKLQEQALGIEGRRGPGARD